MRSRAVAILFGSVLLTSACASLPVFVPDMARVDSRARSGQSVPVQLKTAAGPLSTQQSKAVLDRLRMDGKRAGRDVDGIFDRHLAIEESIVGSPLITGNRVVLLRDGPATFDAMFAAIRDARDHINMETYIIEDDEIGRRFAQALIDKQKRGVQVNLIYDSVGAIGTPREFFQPMIDAGIKVLEFNPVNPLQVRKGWDVNQRDHRKLLVVDGHTAFLGGINVSSVYSSGSSSASLSRSDRRAGPQRARAEDGKRAPELPWRDTHLMVQGPSVVEFQKLFLQTWEKQRGDPLPARRYLPKVPAKGKDVVRAVGSSPDDAQSPIYVTLLSAINSAESHVLLTNAYFVPDPQLLAALKAAAARRVDVRLILPSTTDFWLVLHAGRAHYTDLLRAGVRIYERRDALLHSKTAVVDGVWSTVGSTNLDWRSFLHNDELNAVVLGAEFAAQMTSMFEADLAASDEVTLERWRARSMLDRVKELTARMWEYWL